MKLYVLIAVITLFAFFSNDFGLVDIQKTAIILAAGLDTTESGVRLTTQISVPKAGDRASGGSSAVNVEGNGATVAECVADIYSQTGWVPKFVFCNLILFGEETAKTQNVMGVLDYFLRSESVSDSCFVAVCEGTASELITSQSAIEDTTSAALEKLFSDAAEKSGKVMKNNLKEFAVGYFGVSQSSYMPFIRADEQEEQSGAAGGGSGGSSGGGESQTKSGKIYSARETALFSKGKLSALLSEEETFVFSLLKGNVTAGALDLERDSEPINVLVFQNDGGVSLESKNKPTATFSISVSLRMNNRGAIVSAEELAREQVPQGALDAAKEKLLAGAQRLWEISSNADCDLFFLKRSLYRSSVKKYKEWNETLLSSADTKFVVKTESIQ